jgi:hypothetical protein
MAKEIGNWSKTPRGKSPQRRPDASRRTQASSSGPLEPGEKAVWTGASRYRTPELKGPQDIIMAIAGIGFAGLLIMLLNAIGTADFETLIFMAICATLLGAGFALTLKDYLPQTYILTKKRILLRPRHLPMPVDIDGPGIRGIAIRGGPARGDVIISHDRSATRDRMSASLTTVLVDVENPAQTADLIRTTLAPHITVATLG